MMQNVYFRVYVSMNIASNHNWHRFENKHNLTEITSVLVKMCNQCFQVVA